MVQALRRRVAAHALSAALCLVLVACGGGGGSGGNETPGDNTTPTLSGTAALSGATEVLLPTSVAPVLPQGVSGTPSCTQVSGSLPAGLILGANCTLSGTPTEAGSFRVGVTLTVSGYQGTLAVDGTLSVVAPRLTASAAPAPVATAQQALAPYQPVALDLAGFTLRPGDEVVYRVTEDALPPGLTLDPATGGLSGTPTTAGDYSLRIGARLQRSGAVYEMTPVLFSMPVAAAPVDLRGEGAYVGPFDVGPGFTYEHFTLVLDDGQAWITVFSTEPSIFGAEFGKSYRAEYFYTGRSAPAGGVIPSFTVQDSFTIGRLRTFNLAGTYNAETGGLLRLTNAAGDVEFLAGTTPPASRYDYAQAPVDAAPPGTFTVDGGESLGGNFSINADGTINGQINTTRCAFSGTWTARPRGKNVIDLTFEGQCFGSTDALKGVAYVHHYLVSGQDVHQLVVMAVTPPGAAPHSVMFHGPR
jgi:Putative Ig domain